MATTAQDLKNVMSKFFGGSERRIRHNFNPNFIFTHGVESMAEKAGAFWLLDIVATEMAPLYQKAWKEGKASIAAIKLNVTEDRKAEISLILDEEEPVWTRNLDFTDFPAGEWSFFMGTDEYPEGNYIATMMLTEEY
ncbi:hypothetical protein LC612_35810 [Nostoc sp. CHAB 5834]|nr:hypothetical protein [Nostoc sp. CHAB 5834]